MKKVWEAWTGISLVVRILVGLIIGAILGLAVPQATAIGIFGESCTGKSTLAAKLKEHINAQIYTGRDYLRL